METLLHQVGLPSPAQIARASSWNKGSPKLINLASPLHYRRTRVLQAQGRGFGTTISEKNRRAKGEGEMNGNNSSNEDDEIPEVVFNRMIRRILVVVGTPMASGIGLLYVLSSLRQMHVLEVPGWLPFVTILLSFGTSAFGIAYGTLSTSWDPNKEGSFLGWEEAQKNWPELWKDEDEKR
ncbi:uncharacterized protein PAM68-like [Typha latifolia]|uniref:uncharacterized protein PAM68-like n=1 Tax=Typha latifolia TaxID=4733 RepID=UPI003C2F80C5